MSIETRRNLGFVSVSATNTPTVISGDKGGSGSLRVLFAGRHGPKPPGDGSVVRGGKQGSAGPAGTKGVRSNWGTDFCAPNRAEQSVRRLLALPPRTSTAERGVPGDNFQWGAGASGSHLNHRFRRPDNGAGFRTGGSRTCFDRVGSHGASRGDHVYPSPFRLSRISAPTGSKVRGAEGPGGPGTD
jgi:hypothetical protein